MNAVREAMRQHDAIEAELTAVVEERRSEVRARALRRLEARIAEHFAAEERELFDAVAPRLILVGCEAFREEHRRLIETIRALAARPRAPSDGELRALREAFVRHASDEEIELLPEVRRRFDSDELEAIGDRMALGRARSEESATT